MKKLFVAAALALTLTMASQQTASAWSEFKFSAGVNLGWVGGGNRLFWGAYHSAPYPGGQDLGPWFPGVGAALGYPGQGYAAPAYTAPVAPLPPVAPVAPLAPPAHGSLLPQTYGPSYDGAYQPVSYYYTGSYYQAPTYWYGR